MKNQEVSQSIHDQLAWDAFMEAIETIKNVQFRSDGSIVDLRDEKKGDISHRCF